jgi:cbb3-type cytochrome oxidase maturation protein
MDILYLLIPLSTVLLLLILAVFGWAVYRGQFDDLEREGQRILEYDGGLEHDGGDFDDNQASPQTRPEQSGPPVSRI